MNTVRVSYRTDHVSCYIDAASFGYHSANTRTTIFASSTTNQYNSNGHHIRTA